MLRGPDVGGDPPASVFNFIRFAGNEPRARMLLRQISMIVSPWIVLVSSFEAFPTGKRGLQVRHVFRVPPGILPQISAARHSHQRHESKRSPFPPPDR